MPQNKPFRPVREVMPDGVIHYRCPNCSPDERRIIAKGIFTGWIEGYCRWCKRYYIFHEPISQKTKESQR